MPKKDQRAEAQLQPSTAPSHDWLLWGLLLLLILSLVTYWHFSRQYFAPAPNTESEITDDSNPTLSPAELQQQLDFNQDGQVDASDAAFLKASFYQTDNEALRADLNADGKVDTQDYSLFSKYSSEQANQ